MKSSTKTKTFLAILLIAVFGILIIFFLNRQNQGQNQNIKSMPPTKPVDSTKITDFPWKLQSYINSYGEEIVLPNDWTLTSEFSKGSVGGNAGCNDYGGDAVFDDSKITISNMIGTQMDCEAGKTETDFLANMQKASTYKISDKILTIFDANGKTLLKYEPLL